MIKKDELKVLENEFGLEFDERGITVSTKVVSNKFEKEHSKVIRSVETIKENNSSQNWLQYFIPSEYKDSTGKTNKEYLLTRDGFSLLVMGFTGQKALQWKLKYIEAFNKMEVYIKKQSTAITTRQAEDIQKSAISVVDMVSQIGTTIGQYMGTMTQFQGELSNRMLDVVKDSINTKDAQIDEIKSFVCLRDKNTKYLVETLKDKLTKLCGKKVTAKNSLYIKIKNKIFRKYKVFSWEQIPVTQYNGVYADIDSLEKDDVGVA